MAASRLIEEEAGVFTARSVHPHNGYYAGDFSTHQPLPAAAWERPITREPWATTDPR